MGQVYVYSLQSGENYLEKPEDVEAFINDTFVHIHIHLAFFSGMNGKV